jgi:hypothetical protein
MATYFEMVGLNRLGKSVFRLEPNWWDLSEVPKPLLRPWTDDFSFPSYPDSYMDLQPAEAGDLHLALLPLLLEEIDFYEKLSQMRTDSDKPDSGNGEDGYAKHANTLKAQRIAFEAALDSKHGEVRFRLWVRTWESGL